MHDRILFLYAHPTVCLAVIPLLLVLYSAITVLYRLQFHPLARFPGPTLAAATSLYRKYYDVVDGGEFLRQVLKLHAIYGPVVRISPNELHFNDHRAYHEIYCVESRFIKDAAFYRCFNVNHSVFGAIDPEDSRVRRTVMHTFFSRQAILNLEDRIREKIELLIVHLQKRSSTPSNMFLAFRTATLDIIAEYLFGWSHSNVNAHAFEAPLLLDIQASVPLLWLTRCFPRLIPFLPFIPRWLSPSIHRQFQAFCSVQSFLVGSLARATAETSRTSWSDQYPISHTFLDPSRRPKCYQTSSPKPPFLDEALSLIQAGSDTVGNTLTVGTSYILQNNRIRRLLYEELKAAWPDKEDHISVEVLHSLPYLTAVIKEALRLSHGFVTPLPRVVGSQGAKIAGYDVPSFTIVGMSAVCVHLNQELFPQPKSFIPERWLQPTSTTNDRFLVSFSKGPRSCLGSSMAMAELYLFFGLIFRKLDMAIVGSQIDDFNNFKDYFVPVHEGKGLYITAKWSD